jgi:hypothetical protein
MSLDEPDAFKAADTVLFLAMFVLTFPSGFAAVGFTIIYSQIMSERPTNSMDLIIIWIVFVAVGYIQWFKLLPWIASKLFQVFHRQQ